MRILIFSWRDIKNPEAGGSEIYFHEMAKRWIKKGNEVYWLTSSFKNAKKYDEIDGIKVFRRGGKFSQYLLLPLFYLRYFSKNIDLVVDVENGIPFFTPFFAKGKKVLHIHHVHKEVWANEVKFPFSWIGYFLEMKLMPKVYKNTPVITLCKSSAQDILHERLSKKVIGTVPPGIEFWKGKRYPKTNKPTVLFLNRIKKYKGIKIFLDAAKLLKEYDFIVAGDGDYLNEMKKYARMNKLTNVKFLGRVSDEKKSELLQKSWIFVNPSFKEGWGIVNIEASQCGTPVIGSDTTGIKDSVSSGNTGLLFKPGDHRELAEKIKLLVENRKLYGKFSKNSRKWAKKFDWKAISEEYLDLLREVIK